jgi:hypothetical protein
VAGQTLHFQTSGLLAGSNKVMVDRETGTLWQQLTGEAIAGPLAGRSLDLLSVETLTWTEWWEQHPDAEMLELPAPFTARSEIGEIQTSYTYTPEAVQPAYYASASLWFPARSAGGALAAKTLVATLALGEEALAVDLGALRERGPVVLTLGDRVVVAVPTAAGARFHDAGTTDLAPGQAATAQAAAELPPLPSGQSFWFAWHALHPTSAVWPDG